MAISKKQISLVHIAKKQLMLSEDDYRAILLRYGGVDHSNELDNNGFEHVMQYMAALGFKADWTRTFYGHRKGMASPAQVNLIRQIWSEYTDGEGDNASLDKWLGSFFGISALRFVTKFQAAKIITALKNMKARKRSQEK